MSRKPLVEVSVEAVKGASDSERSRVLALCEEIRARAGDKRIIGQCSFFRVAHQRTKSPDDTLDLVATLRQTATVFEPLGTPLAALSTAIPIVVAGLSYIGADLERLNGENLSDSCDAIVEGRVLLAGYVHKKHFLGFQELPHKNVGLEFEFQVSAVVLDNMTANDLEIDFQDGKGYQPLRVNESYFVNYQDYGTRRISVRSSQLGLEDGFSFENVRRLGPSVSYDEWTLMGASLCNHPGGAGWADVVYGVGKTKETVDKVFIISEGFPGGMSFQDFWDKLNGFGAGLADQLILNGITVVLLRYRNGTAMIQTNAGVAVAAYDQMKYEFKGRNPLKIVWSGASMGGVVMMYALRWLLANRPTDKIAADMFFATFDSPLTLIANVPFSIQVLLHVLDEQGQLPGRQRDRFNELRSDAAGQMLALWAFDDGDLKETLLKELGAFKDQWDKPERTAFLVSGSRDASLPSSFPPPNEWVFEWSYSVFEYKAHLSVTANDGQGHLIAEYKIPNSDLWKQPLGGKVSVTLAPNSSYDTAPGAIGADYFGDVYDGFKELDKGDTWLRDQHRTCFIPAVSAANRSTHNLFEPVGGDDDTNVRANAHCEEHLVFDSASIAWLSNRIFAYYGLQNEALLTVSSTSYSGGA